MAMAAAEILYSEEGITRNDVKGTERRGNEEGERSRWRGGR